MRNIAFILLSLSLSSARASETCLSTLLNSAAPIILHFQQASGLILPGGAIPISAASLYAAHRTGFLPERGNIWEMPEYRGMVSLEGLSVKKGHRSKFARILEAYPELKILFNKAPGRVIDGCASMRRDSDPWLTDDVVEGYKELARLGLVYSIELWDGDRLVAGDFGIVSGSHVQGISKFRDLDHPLSNGGGTLLEEAENYYFWTMKLKTKDVEVAEVKGTGRRKQGVEAWSRVAFLKWLEEQNTIPAELFPGAIPGEPLPIIESSFPARFREMRAQGHYSYEAETSKFPDSAKETPGVQPNRTLH